MSGVETVEVGPDEDELRLDRWFRRHYPGLTHGRLEKLLRTGQVRVDGRRARAGQRLSPGQQVRVPPQADVATGAAPAPAPRSAPTAQDAAFVQSLVIHRDDDVIALNKPPGLAVQGGTRTVRHIDGMLDALRFDAKERPRLVHRLDRDTSGVLLLARSARAAAWLGRTFQSREIRKIYWALVVGMPDADEGMIDLPLGKQGPAGRERMAGDEERGKRAQTLYRVLERAGNRVAWLALWPLTGRTHQLRVHCAAIGTPIVGDRKYGGPEAMLPADGVAERLHLHARELVLPKPSGRGELRIRAPLPPHMAESWRLFGFDATRTDDPFEDLD